VLRKVKKYRNPVEGHPLPMASVFDQHTTFYAYARCDSTGIMFSVVLLSIYSLVQYESC